MGMNGEIIIGWDSKPLPSSRVLPLPRPRAMLVVNWNLTVTGQRDDLNSFTRIYHGNCNQFNELSMRKNGVSISCCCPSLPSSCAGCGYQTCRR